MIIINSNRELARDIASEAGDTIYLRVENTWKKI
ncbi:MAG: hypothetical protein GPOALKHO_000108 [Sodalis sp.]|nr:MAG: hypothetical protein GPOALKHO_000108 [Sodalis sp.]